MTIIQALHVLKSSCAIYGGKILSIKLNPQAYDSLKKELEGEAIFKATAFENHVLGECRIMGVDVFVEGEK